jgi:hypothetical protein
MWRAITHDMSKFSIIETKHFVETIHQLHDVKYGDQKYYKVLGEAKQAINHHYKINRHHPEFHKQGIRGMSFIDLVEMICDWKAATRKHKDGDINSSIDINAERFGYDNASKKLAKKLAKEL